MSEDQHWKDLIEKKSVNTKDLDSKTITEICSLKDSHWKFGLESQLEWFKKNIRENDIHNCLYLGNKLVAYTTLRKLTCRILSHSKILESYYLLFDTSIVRNDFRKKSMGSCLMYFNCKIILKQKTFSILICKNILLDFYKKFGWKKLDNEKIQIHNHLFSTNAMIFNEAAIDTSEVIQIDNLSLELDLSS